MTRESMHQTYDTSKRKMRNWILSMFKFVWYPWTKAEVWRISWNTAQLNKEDHEKVLINKEKNWRTSQRTVIICQRTYGDRKANISSKFQARSYLGVKSTGTERIREMAALLDISSSKEEDDIWNCKQIQE